MEAEGNQIAVLSNNKIYYANSENWIQIELLFKYDNGDGTS